MSRAELGAFSRVITANSLRRFYWPIVLLVAALILEDVARRRQTRRLDLLKLNEDPPFEC